MPTYSRIACATSHGFVLYRILLHCMCMYTYLPIYVYQLTSLRPPFLLSPSRQECMQAGMQGFLEKPLNQARLKQTLLRCGEAVRRRHKDTRAHTAAAAAPNTDAAFITSLEPSVVRGRGRILHSSHEQTGNGGGEN